MSLRHPVRVTPLTLPPCNQQSVPCSWHPEYVCVGECVYVCVYLREGGGACVSTCGCVCVYLCL